MHLPDGHVAGGGHHRGERQDSRGVLDRDRLSDGAAQRETDDMRGIKFERVEQTDGVRSHI